MNIKRAARTVIIDKKNRTAIIEVRGGEYYKIPGGAIEPGESDEEAATREALEESGCEVELIEKIGEHQFTDPKPEYNGLIHFSVCYLAKKISQGDTNFDEWERASDFKLKWVTFQEAVDLFSKSHPLEPIRKEINQRDWNFVAKAKSILKL